MTFLKLINSLLRNYATDWNISDMSDVAAMFAKAQNETSSKNAVHLAEKIPIWDCL